MTIPEQARLRRNEPVSLYVHVPFCVSKCAYCDFVSEEARDVALHARFVDAVLEQAAVAKAAGVLDKVATVYFGGGTPTSLGEQAVRLVRGVLGIVTPAEGVEVTVEANPESTTTALVRDLIAAGATRFSLGIQSFDESALARLGRCHSMAQAVRAAAILHDSGVPFSVDLICGIPGQSEASWMSTVLRAVSTGAGHMSVYPLTVEEGTPLAAMVDAGSAPEPDPDRAADDMVAAEELLESAGIMRYETANYARPGSESRHNLGYWTGRAYLGLGPSAASMMPTTDGGRVRWTQTYDIREWIDSCGEAEAAELETLSADEAAREDAMLGLRLREGIGEALAARAGALYVLRDLAEEGLVERVEPDDAEAALEDEARWRLSDRGWLLGNEVFARVWAGR